MEEVKISREDKLKFLSMSLDERYREVRNLYWSGITSMEGMFMSLFLVVRIAPFYCT